MKLTHRLFDRELDRREFLKISGKVLLAVLVWSIFPLKFSLLQNKGGGKRKFTIRVKPFRIAAIYKQHNLIG